MTPSLFRTFRVALSLVLVASFLPSWSGCRSSKEEHGKGRTGTTPEAGTSRPETARAQNTDAGKKSPSAKKDGRPLPSGWPKLSEAHRKIFWESIPDPRPRSLTRNVHYWAGNEWDNFVFYEDIKDLKGGYVGVGADQGYMYLSWMRAELAWLCDYDYAVVALHWVFRAFFLEAATAEEFIELWSKKERKRSSDLLRRTYAKSPDLKIYIWVHTRASERVHSRLKGIVRRSAKWKIPCYLTDAGMYGFTRNMVKEGRVRPLLGNLLGPRGLVNIGEAARKLSVPVRVFYPSNAEEYWKKYTPQFRANIKAMPFDSRSVVIRTMTASKEQGEYSYHTQPAANFVAWLDVPWVHRVYAIKTRKVKRLKSVKYRVADLLPPSRARARPKRRRPN